MSIKSVVAGTEKVWIEISREALTHNVHRVRTMIGPQVSLLAVVKADAYGMGLREISRILWEAGVDFFGVTNIQEGITLRSDFPKVPILILGPSFMDNIDDIIDQDLQPMVSSLELLKKLNETALLKGKKVKVHLMMDTGMGRIGLWYEKGEEFFKRLLEMKSLDIAGVASHFACADNKNLDFTHLQLSRFQEFLFKLKVMGIEVPHQHIANSSAVLRVSESLFNMVRVGLILHGIAPSPWVSREGFKPAISWKTKIAFIKEVDPGRTISYGGTFVATNRTKIATLPVGYSHGYDRILSNRGEVLIGGLRCPVVGRVTMDQIMVDLGSDSSAKVDDEAVLIGVQGEQEMTIEEMAEKADTIPYELMCRIKVKRIYI